VIHWFLLLIFFIFPVLVSASEIDLNIFQDKSLADCDNNVPCSRLSRWQCITQSCYEEGNQKPTDCYATFNGDKAAADFAICQAESIPTKENIQYTIDAIPGARPDDVIQGLMMMRAIKGDAIGCQEGIKEYVGPYGQSWTPFWLVAMSGCRILSNERSWQEEDADYQIWNEVSLGTKMCVDIKDIELQAMCNAGVLMGKQDI
jgi:hypothetical protein